MITWKDVLEAEETDDRRKVGDMCSGITVFRQGRALILDLPDDGFSVFASGYNNDGFFKGTKAVMNISGMGGKPEFDCMMGGLEEYDESIRQYLNRMGYDHKGCVCMSTAANMDNAIITNMVSPDGIRVSSAITGGIRHNGGRSGDPAGYDEVAIGRTEEKSGTIIILLSIDADLSKSSMMEAMLIATEAKSALIQELQARSLYTNNIATGSGTDQVAVIACDSSPVKMDHIDRATDLARTIVCCVKEGLREALDRQSGMNVELQTDVMTVLSRYNLTQETIREEMRFSASMDELMGALEVVRKDKYLSAMAMAVLEIEDRVRNGNIDARDGLCVAKRICRDAVLGGELSRLEEVRLEGCDTIPEVVSYTAAVKLFRTVKARRCSDE